MKICEEKKERFVSRFLTPPFRQNLKLFEDFYHHRTICRHFCRCFDLKKMKNLSLVKEIFRRESVHSL